MRIKYSIAGTNKTVLVDGYSIDELPKTARDKALENIREDFEKHCNQNIWSAIHDYFFYEFDEAKSDLEHIFKAQIEIKDNYTKVYANKVRFYYNTTMQEILEKLANDEYLYLWIDRTSLAEDLEKGFKEIVWDVYDNYASYSFSNFDTMDDDKIVKIDYDTLYQAALINGLNYLGAVNINSYTTIKEWNYKADLMMYKVMENALLYIENLIEYYFEKAAENIDYFHISYGGIESFLECCDTIVFNKDGDVIFNNYRKGMQQLDLDWKI